MSIKLRLILSYVAMLIIPFILLMITNYYVLSYVIGNLGEGSVGMERFNFFKQLNMASRNFSRKVNLQILSDTEKFLDEDYIKEIENEIDFEYAGIVLRKDKEIIHTSANIKNNIGNTQLPDFGSEENLNKTYNLSTEKELFTMEQQDFYFKDNSRGTIFYVVNIHDLKETYSRAFIFMIIVTLVILAATNGILTYLVSKSIIKPLKELEHSANEIKNGNLEYKTKVYSKDEIGEVGIAFEDMRQRLKKSLETQILYEKNRKELISNISHDLKTPITSIKGYIEGIKDGVAASPDKMNKYINTIYTKAAHMDQLIDELFLYSKLDLNKLPFDFQRIDITTYLQDCVEELRFDMDKDRVNLNLNAPEKSILVMVDIQKLKRVILNIVENSIKYMKDKKLDINIKLNEKEEYVVIEIQDNGKGISEEAIPFIFDRFYRADTARNIVTGGSGLGLAIVKKIVEGHGGEISACSEMNQGTTILFTLKKA